jgi:hypothetical protein
MVKTQFESEKSVGEDQARPLGFRKVEAPRISRQSAHEDGKVVSLTHRPPLPPPHRRYPRYSFVSEAELIPGP